MANAAVVPAVPTGDGLGATSSVAALGADKEIIVAGPFTGTVTIEGSPDGTSWAPIVSFTTPGRISKRIACTDVRVRRTGFINGAAPVVSLSAEDIGATGITIVVPAGNGSGASVSADGLGPIKTCYVTFSSLYIGTVTIESSDDGTNWAPVQSFSGTGLHVSITGGEFFHARVSGYIQGTATAGAAGSQFAASSGGAAAGAFVPQAGPFFTTAPAVRTGRAIFVNPADASAADDGDPDVAKLTIGGALASITAPGNELEQQCVWTIFVAGGCYDEDVVLPSFGVWLQMVALGRVTIGDGTQTGGGSSTARSVTWLPEDAVSFALSTIVFSSLDAGGVIGYSASSSSLAAGTSYGWRVSGDVVIDNPVGPSDDNIYLDLSNMYVEGDFDTSGFSPFPVGVSAINSLIGGDLIFGTSTVCSLVRGSVIVGGITGNLRRMERVEVGGTVTAGGAQSAGEWFDSRPFTFVLDPTSTPPKLDKFTSSYLASILWAPTLGPLANESMELIGVWGSADIGAAAGSVFPPPGNGTVAGTDSWGIGTTRTCYLAQVACTINLGVADGDNIEVDVLADGVEVYTTGAFASTAGVHNFNLNPMVLITDTTLISVRVTKLANITNGAVNFTVALYSY